MSIHVLDDGTCAQVRVSKTPRGFFWERRALYVHHTISNPRITLLSPLKKEAVLSDKIPIFGFCLPPPLNAFVYPSPLLAVKLDENDEITPIGVQEFIQMCASLEASALKPSETAAVYDVPAIPFTIADDEGLYDEYEDEELNNDDDEEFREDGDDDDDIEDDDDWVPDEDDEIQSAI